MGMNKQLDQEAFARYDKCLCAFCRESAMMEDMVWRIENGKKLPEWELEYHLATMRNVKQSLIQSKCELGFIDELAFTKDNYFQGFRYQKGRLSGDYTLLTDIVLPWVTKFDPDHRYQYEVGTLLMFHYMYQKKRRGFFSLKTREKSVKEPFRKRLFLFRQNRRIKKYEKKF